MSHEVRTPLNAILGFAEILNGQYFGPIGQDRYVEYAGDIQTSGKHLLDLVNDILDIERIEAGKYDLKFEQQDASAVLAECRRIIGQRAEEAGINLVVETAVASPSFRADARAEANAAQFAVELG